ncbi:MAG TPA: DEAD/DEAH box helicase [Candidatus Kapabacteria bacterium]|nr:DEAD/DEAH box helicase [Candidatus Kapabacteria bacterium]
MVDIEGKDIRLDKFQEEAIAAVEADQSVLVSAPTGAGKTLIAEFLIKESLTRDRGVIYTAPIKALSNQKYREFEHLFPGKVGIITGDVNINPRAPLLIMTTEIFRNKVLEFSTSLDEHNWIIFDEIHYLDNVERGTVWEESLIFLPQQMKFLGLSATIPNVDQFADWLRKIHRHPITVIKETNRPVPLHFLFQCGNAIYESLDILRNFVYTEKKPFYYKKAKNELFPVELYGEDRTADLIQHLVEKDRLPCIYFSFSRKRCEGLANAARPFGFLNAAERQQVLEIYDSFCMQYNLTGEERAQDVRSLVARGVAYHHAGIHPMLKEILERLFTQKLIKIIFTTETFALGINMPARTVVLDEVKKSYGRFYRALKVRDFFQMAGRSGRRGIDKEGFVYSRVNPRSISFRELQAIFKSPPEIIRSRFNASYATILNLYETYGDALPDIYRRSFNYFQEKSRGGRQLEQMTARLNILKHLGYIHKNQLTEKGHFAKNMHGNELPLAELFGYGVLEDLSLKQLGILALAAVFEPRPGVRKPKFSDEVKELERITTQVVKGIHRFEKKMGLSYFSKKFYYGLSASIVEWMEQKSFDKLMENLQIDEGELIRYYRMSLQILREMLDTPASEELKDKIRHAIHLINREVVDAEEQLKKSIDLAAP